MDAIRIAPAGRRARWRAGPTGMEVLAFGPHHEGDTEMVEDFWDD